ncbi:MATE family efflux transporter [Pseudomonas lundensis]|uniref:MATE family efflux transporter n=1 Tax=Pseudomonas lundensis TaxID=86185 RepID=UPI0014757656|nr:MATE family efflux transporter [Pseudomonas lundensis]NNA16426.1 MATE family efflux transporter [Pseudomonas lundensis]
MTLHFKLQGVHIVTLSGWLAKLIVAASQIVLMRLMLDVLGVEDYSVYVVIFSLYTWFSLMDFGVGYSYQNYISRCRAEGKTLVDDGRFFTLAMIVLACNFLIWPISIFCVLMLLYGQVSWGWMEIQLIVMFCGVAHLTCVFSTVYKIFFAEHKGYISNIFPAIASLITVALVLLAANTDFFNGGLFLAVLLTYGPLALMAATCFLYKVKRALNFDYVWGVSIVRNGWKYMAFTFLSLLTLNIDLLVVSRSLSSIDVVEYNLILKVFSLVLYLYSAYLMALMPVAAELIRKGEFPHLRTKIKSGIVLGFALVFLSTCFIVFFNGFVSAVLTGGVAAIHVGMVVMFFFYMFIRIWTDTFSTLLQSVGFMGGMLLCVAIQALISIAAQLWLVNELGSYGVILGVIASFLLTVVWFLPFQYRKIELGAVRL